MEKVYRLICCSHNFGIAYAGLQKVFITSQKNISIGMNEITDKVRRLYAGDISRWSDLNGQ